MKDTIKAIKRLKKERNAIILSHVYQPAEIQDIADLTGDSLELARKAAATEADVIVCCGVHFMAESAYILSPDKIVLLPASGAGCQMADMVSPDRLLRAKKEHPEALVVAYVNTSAKVKALSDICCTSANAARVVSSLPEDREILFVPDQNLGDYVNGKTGRNMTCWQGFCPVHHNLSAAQVDKVKGRHPDALILAHPECPQEVLHKADFVSSTMGIINYVEQSEKDAFIIATECGVLHPLQKKHPDKKFYLVSEAMVCPDMKRTTLEKVKEALETLEPRVVVDEDTRAKAAAGLTRMLDLCRQG